MPGRADQDCDEALRLLDDAWDKAAQHWRDEAARHFGTRYLAPLLHESRCYLEALRKLADVLSAAEFDTEHP